MLDWVGWIYGVNWVVLYRWGKRKQGSEPNRTSVCVKMCRKKQDWIDVAAKFNVVNPRPPSLFWNPLVTDFHLKWGRSWGREGVGPTGCVLWLFRSGGALFGVSWTRGWTEKCYFVITWLCVCVGSLWREGEMGGERDPVVGFVGMLVCDLVMIWCNLHQQQIPPEVPVDSSASARGLVNKLCLLSTYTQWMVCTNHRWGRTITRSNREIVGG